MKKLFLSLLFLVLVSAPNKATAENVILSRCFMYVGSPLPSFDKFDTKNIEKDQIEKIGKKLRRVEIYSDSGHENMQRIYKEKKFPISHSKINIENFTITYEDKDYIKAEDLETERSIVVNLKEKTFATTYGLINYTSNYKCEKSHNIASGGSTGSSAGTAFFVNNKGNIVTNNHVVERCSGPVKLFYNRKEHTAKIVARDGALDLAVLSSDVKPSQYLKLSKKSGDKLDRVVAAGYPLGHKISDELKVTSGIVSATKGWKDNINEIQIDAALNPGNSGGPVVNDAGNLLGVAVAGLKDRQNLNFAIKSKAVKDFLDVNKISYSTAAMDFDMDNKKRLKLLEDSTVYIYCN